MWPVARMGEVTEVSPLYGTEVEAEAMAAPVESAQHIRPVEAEPLILGEISTEASSYDDDDDPPCGCCCEGSKGGAECCGHDHVWTSCWAISAVAAMVVFWWMYQTWYETFRAPREPGEVREPRERARRGRRARKSARACVCLPSRSNADPHAARSLRAQPYTNDDDLNDGSAKAEGGEPSSAGSSLVPSPCEMDLGIPSGWTLCDQQGESPAAQLARNLTTLALHAHAALRGGAAEDQT